MLTEPLNKKKILQMVFSGLGGTSAVAFSLVEGAKNIDKKKYSFFFLFNGVEKLLPSHVKICQNISTPYKYIYKKNIIHNLFSISNFLFKKKFDVIIVHDFPLFIFFIFKFINKFKLIYVHHTPDLTKGIKYWFLYVFNSLFADQTVVVSNRKKISFFNRLNKFFLLKPKVIINGINKNYFLSKKIKKTKNFKLGMAARFHSDKRQDLLLKIFKKYKKILIKNKITLSLAGDGPTKNELYKFVKRNGLGKLIKFEGNLNQLQIKKWFKSLNLYLHLSKDETSSTSILQALSSGLPVISSNVGGNFGLRKKYKGVDNIVLVDNNINKIYFKIIKIYQSLDLQNRMSQSARRSIDLHFNYEKMFKKYSKLF